ncbi:hypothetical protein [Lacihabitans soyangensis]|uniref:Cytochrome c domain-containing protein n=1 Tax=Lacihabitans soyangensis TaxID=869394 RepID=A0AAE3KXR8_9BACT|nr:hypothetical protein [Lacihabitans soyangensis]MCP9765625.1 hypothetical protein [Lacihabitans soyangensis]
MKNLKKISLLLIIGLCWSCGTANKPEEEILTSTNFNINFSMTPPPDLLDSNATPQQLVEFAWEEFFALNWQSSFDKDGLRDHPDPAWSYNDSSSAYPSLAVWETFAHRTELRPASDKMLPFDTAPHYSFGTMPAQDPGSNASFGLFNMLDENNEIGSCDIYAHTNTYNKDYRVLFQAKVNRDEYDYILNKYPTKSALANATAFNVSRLKNSNEYAPGVLNSCNVPTNFAGISLPCGDLKTKKTGAIEIKTAWRELTPKDDSTKFFRRKVIRFVEKAGKFYYQNKEYALIGIHIIHKTNNYEDFVFATWEHVGVEKDGMGYEELNNGNEVGKFYKDYPRLHPIADITDQSTAYVHAQLKKMNPKSIWQNYRLVGVQAKPTNDQNSFSFFLANYVIESDSTLGNFQGSGIGTPHDKGNNTLYRGKRVSMGGCQGCHGVAQTNLGTDFSFLLDNVGKPVPNPDPDGDKTKLFKLITATNPRK